MEAVLSVQSINKHYPGFTLENVSFSLAPNRIMGLIGKKWGGEKYNLKSYSQHGVARKWECHHVPKKFLSA